MGREKMEAAADAARFLREMADKIERGLDVNGEYELRTRRERIERSRLAEAMMGIADGSGPRRIIHTLTVDLSWEEHREQREREIREDADQA
jgi:hypothetical protein